MVDGDTTAIRALAHPLRLRLLDLLRIEGPSTSTILAARTGESTGATSYHLRQLARHKFIEELPKEARGRERWWRYAERQVTLEPGNAEPSRQLLRELLAREGAALDHYLADTSRASAFDRAAFVQSHVYRLTPHELDRLRRSFAELFGELRSIDAIDAPKGARPVRILALGFPTPA